MITPTNDHIAGFLQGYAECKKDGIALAEEALKKKRNVVQYLRDQLRTRHATWILRAEQNGHSHMPKSDEVLSACAIGIAVLVAYFIGFYRHTHW